MTPKKSPPKRSDGIRTDAVRTDFARRMKTLLGTAVETEEFFEALEDLTNRGSSIRALRPNLPKLNAGGWSVDDLFRSLQLEKPEPLTWNANAFPVNLKEISGLGDHPALGAGLYYLQEAGATEAVEHLDVQPGQLVLDLCAAPGGKATQMGEKLMGRGHLVANDPVRGRAERLDVMLARHGVADATVTALDPTSLAEDTADFFERIMVDAPCSGESLFAKRQELRKEVGDNEVAGAARRQFLILSRAARMVIPGGRIVYSTCTYSKEENEDVVAAFLEKHPGFTLRFEQRRWPHRDRVAGGYFAEIEREGDVSTARSFEDRMAAWRERGNAGVLRSGVRQWNGEWDDYALLLGVPGEETRGAEATERRALFESVALTGPEAQSYLLGESLRNVGALAAASDPSRRALLTLTWNGFALGPGKLVEDRVNNLLPKRLRGLKR